MCSSDLTPNPKPHTHTERYISLVMNDTMSTDLPINDLIEIEQAVKWRLIDFDVNEHVLIEVKDEDDTHTHFDDTTVNYDSSILDDDQNNNDPHWTKDQYEQDIYHISHVSEMHAKDMSPAVIDNDMIDDVEVIDHVNNDKCGEAVDDMIEVKDDIKENDDIEPKDDIQFNDDIKENDDIEPKEKQFNDDIEAKDDIQKTEQLQTGFLDQKSFFKTSAGLSSLLLFWLLVGEFLVFLYY